MMPKDYAKNQQLVQLGLAIHCFMGISAIEAIGVLFTYGGIHKALCSSVINVDNFLKIF